LHFAEEDGKAYQDAVLTDPFFVIPEKPQWGQIDPECAPHAKHQ